MQKTIVKADDFNAENVAVAAAQLQAGKPIVLPTETVYGIACAMQEAAFLNLYFAKNRPLSKPLPVLVQGKEDAKNLCVDIPPLFWTLAEKYWPGPLTIVLRKNPALQFACLDAQTIALRCSSHPVVQKIIEAFGKPLFLSSANLSGEANASSFAAVVEVLQDKVSFFIDGGNLEKAVPSTIVSLVSDKLEILRQGTVSDSDLASYMR